MKIHIMGFCGEIKKNLIIKYALSVALLVHLCKCVINVLITL